MQARRILEDLILLNRLSLTGAKAVHESLLQGVPPSEILRKIQEENFLNKKSALLELEGNFYPEKEIELAEKTGVGFLTVLDDDYPQRLRHIADPPLVLYIKGSLLEVDRAALAIVGTRHPSFYGMTQGRKISRGLAEKGFTIISGLAQGIDQIAHTASLEVAYGRTVAVLGCGIDIDYPSRSQKIREDISERGAIITEYAFGTAPRAENFPRRNRIIAGLSLGTLVVEAHSRSGSLITAHLAADEGREVFAIPGSVDQLGSRGTHRLIKEGAHLVESVEDVVEVLASVLTFQTEAVIPKKNIENLPEISKPEPEGLSFSGQEEELLHFLRKESLSGEELSDRVTCSSGQLSSILTFLELKGKIRREYNGRFVLSRGD